MELIISFLLICSAQAVLKTIDWRSGDNGFVRWNFDCDIKGDDVESHKARGEDCGPLCLADTRKWCNAFVWTQREGNCWLKRSGTVVASGNIGGICGIIEHRPETSTYRKSLYSKCVQTLIVEQI